MGLVLSRFRWLYPNVLWEHTLPQTKAWLGGIKFLFSDETDRLQVTTKIITLNKKVRNSKLKWRILINFRAAPEEKNRGGGEKNQTHFALRTLFKHLRFRKVRFNCFSNSFSPHINNWRCYFPGIMWWWCDEIRCVFTNTLRILV